mmetsp:Transcript_5149/g.12893  ORF Transcript_5149/g.12893 Transcript_5149/m.12893 type:complete len:93 (+) Transcript_5149:1-279(+)
MQAARLRVPAAPQDAAKKRKRREPAGAKRGVLHQYDDVPVQKLSLRKTLAVVAEELRQEHGLSEEVCNRKTVEGRARYLKKNGLYKLPPLNE